MRSESLRRFHAEQSEPSVRGENGAAQRRAELDEHIAEFLARGGEVKQIPSTFMVNPVYGFNLSGQRQ